MQNLLESLGVVAPQLVEELVRDSQGPQSDYMLSVLEVKNDTMAGCFESGEVLKDVELACSQSRLNHLLTLPKFLIMDT